ncbi:MAG: hypothetical protein R3B70_42100 [Polyangiaceae bacterium]
MASLLSKGHWTRALLPIPLWLAGAGALLSAGCGEIEPVRGGGGAGGEGSGASGGAMSSAAGSGGAGGTGAGEPLCGCSEVGGVPSECVALTDNSKATKSGLRMAQLQLQLPAAFKNPVTAGPLEQGVTPNLKSCALSGDGTFSWLIELDEDQGILQIGSARPVADPTEGYCFIDETLAGIAVQPATAGASIRGGVLSMDASADVVIVIFLGGAESFLLLPLRGLLLGGALSADKNCIGKLNAELLGPSPDCEPVGDVPWFENGGTIDAHVSLEEADAVQIDALKQSLCVLLTGDPGTGNPKKCVRDANGEIVAKGDFCSVTNEAGGCQDAVRVQGEFAASAVTIHGACPPGP